MKKAVLICLILVSFFGKAQSDSIAYSHEYDFKEGIYLSYSDFKHNHPIPVSAIVLNYPKTQLDFLTEVMKQKNIVFKDESGNDHKLETYSIWGYCRNHSIYINYLGQFNKLMVIGTLCHFNATVTRYLVAPDPMGMNSTYEEMHQFVYDTNTNKAFEFDVPSMELLLKKDDELYAKFMGLKKREKADAIFVFLRKYNERHLLYLYDK